MHVSIVGAGVLGRIYGARLAAEGEQVSFVVRSDRAGDTAPFIVEQVNGGDRRDVMKSPSRVTDIPDDAEVVLVTVRYHELAPAPAPARVDDGASKPAASMSVPDVLRRSSASKAPVVILTPMMPDRQAALEKVAPGRIVPAMPGVLGYLDDRGIVRYWVPAVTSTILEESSVPHDANDGGHAALIDLARRLTALGLPTRLDHDVASLNAATTTAFFPLIAAIDAGGGVDGVLDDKELLATVLDAAKESRALSRRVGKPAAWAHLLMKFVGPLTLKSGAALVRRLFPESLLFVERHFGAKLHDQHIAMGEAILKLGGEHEVSMPALRRLMDVLRSGEARAERRPIPAN